MVGSPLAYNLIVERKKRNMTIKEFAKFLGVSPSTLFSFKNGSSPRNFNYLKQLAIKLEMPLSLLVLGE
jgi:transcriptional regulator with XRE-family HTH domain